MLIQEQISGPDTLLKLYVAMDEDLKALQPQLRAQQLPADPRGGSPSAQCCGGAHKGRVGRVARAEG